jgi:group I intron endonuclease
MSMCYNKIMYGIIYKITNKINSKIYIGLTTMELKERWACHRTEAKKNNQTLLYKAIRKYQETNFIIEQIDTAENQMELEQKEIFYIEKFNSISPNGYNLTVGGIVSTKQSNDTKNKKSIAQKKRHQNPIEKEKAIQGFKYFWQNATEEQLKIRSNKIKAAWTPERRQQMSEMNKGHKRAYGNTYNRFPIEVFNELTGEIQEFKSCDAACKKLNLTASAISMCLQGKRSRHKGYKFRRIS